MRPHRAFRGKRHAPPLAAGEVHVWTIPLDRIGGEPPSGALSAAEAARARRFRFPADRDRFARSHAAARAILGTYLGLAPAAIAICVSRSGKPRLDPRRHPGLRFNLAHSHALAVLAVSRAEIGVDVEFRRPAPDPDALVRRFFSDAESAAYFALPRRLRPRAFLAAWTLKEAYLKGCGDGLRRRLDSFSVTMRPDAPPRLLDAAGRPGDARRWRLLRLAPRRGYVGAVAVAGRNVRLRERAWTKGRQ
jgi:4'-phosphopantetheinyl transferase